MKLPAWLSGETAKLWTIIAVGIGVGLMGAYGRERHEGRLPDRRWLTNRLLVMPFLALAASAAADGFGLKGNLLGFASALLSMLAYDAVRVITARALMRASAELESLLPADVLVRLPPGDGAPPAMIEVEPSTDGIGAALRHANAGALRAPLSNAEDALLHRLGRDEPSP